MWELERAAWASSVALCHCCCPSLLESHDGVQSTGRALLWRVELVVTRGGVFGLAPVSWKGCLSFGCHTRRFGLLYTAIAVDGRCAAVTTLSCTPHHECTHVASGLQLWLQAAV